MPRAGLGVETQPGKRQPANPGTGRVRGYTHGRSILYLSANAERERPDVRVALVDMDPRAFSLIDQTLEISRVWGSDLNMTPDKTFMTRLEKKPDTPVRYGNATIRSEPIVSEGAYKTPTGPQD